MAAGGAAGGGVARRRRGKRRAPPSWRKGGDWGIAPRDEAWKVGVEEGEAKTGRRKEVDEGRESRKGGAKVRKEKWKGAKSSF